MDTDNITQRKPQLLSNSLSETSNDSSSLFDNTIMSLPNTSLDESNMDNELHGKILNLSNQLQSANHEIDNLNTENIRLKSELEKCHKIINLYKKVGSAEIKCTTPLSGKRKKHRRASSAFTPSKIALHLHDGNIANEDVSKERIDAIGQGERKKETEINKEKSNMVDDVQTIKQKSEETQVSYLDENFEAIEQHPVYEGTHNVEERKMKKIIVIADQRGRNLQKKLKEHVGSDYMVTCFMKPGADLSNLVTSDKKEIEGLSKEDYVILVGGINDKSPYLFQSALNNFLTCTQHTNVLISEIPYNRNLNEKRLNYILRFMCAKYENSVYLDMRYGEYVPRRFQSSLLLCQSMVREILRIDYRHKLQNYRAKQESEKVKGHNILVVNKSTQTDTESVQSPNLQGGNNIDNNQNFPLHTFLV